MFSKIYTILPVVIGKVESGCSICPGIAAVYNIAALSMSDVSIPEPGLPPKRSANRERAPCAGAGGEASDSRLPGLLEGWAGLG